MNIGHVYVVHTNLCRPPKDKLAICICAADNFFFWINTIARSHGHGQFPLQHNDHAALTRSCYLDCSRVTTFSSHELVAAKPRGVISRDLAERIVEYLKNAPPKTLGNRYLKLAIENLSTLIE